MTSSTTYIRGYPLFSARCRINIENELSKDPISIRCTKVHFGLSNDFGIQLIPNKGYYNVTVKIDRSRLLRLFCTFNYPSLNETGQFLAFMDAPFYIDNTFGGRHCTWRFTDDGLYVYHLQRKKFKFVYYWTYDKE
ncbi:hypothetical protein RND81_04G088500 [Saponaria officinalis]|uniref:S-protein homolog n=1 Tax=Saponaria officinalis TaxID=3572 RepID=A0AAW1LK68_SAPOF